MLSLKFTKYRKGDIILDIRSHGYQGEIGIIVDIPIDGLYSILWKWNLVNVKRKSYISNYTEDGIDKIGKIITKDEMMVELL